MRKGERIIRMYSESSKVTADFKTIFFWQEIKVISLVNLFSTEI